MSLPGDSGDTGGSMVTGNVETFRRGAYVGQQRFRKFVEDSAPTFEHFRAEYPDVNELVLARQHL